MKKYFYLALAGIFVCIFGLIFYGTYINHRDESKIAESMAANRSVTLKGSKAAVRKIYPKVVLYGIDLFSREKTDAVALIDGIVTSVNVSTSDDVKAGQTLFVVENKSYPVKIRQADIDILKAESEILKAENDIIKAETTLSNAQHDLNRYTRLRDREAVSLGKFEQVERAFKEAQINLQNLKVQKDQVIAQKESLEAQKEQLLIESSYRNVTTPIDGEVLIIYKQIGAFVTAGTPLALIGNFHNLYFEMAAEDKIVRQLVDVKNVNFTFLQKEMQKIYGAEYKAGNKGDQQIFNASIVDVSPSLDEPAAIRKIIWRIDNSSGLLEPRTYSEVSCQAFLPRQCLTVPLSAIDSQSKDSLFIFMQDGTIKKIPVTTGVDDGKFIEIIDGLNEGDIVVTLNVDNLIDGMKANYVLEGDDELGR